MLAQPMDYQFAISNFVQTHHFINVQEMEMNGPTLHQILLAKLE